MSHYNYRSSQAIEARGYNFYSVLMAAMRLADSDNLNKLQRAFPEVYAELVERYNLPGGKRPYEEITGDQRYSRERKTGE